MLQQRISNSKISLGIFKIYGIYLVGHCTASHFPSFNLLLKIIKTDIGPDIAAKIDEYGIDPFYRVEMCSQQIVMFNLGCILLPLNSQPVFQKCIDKTYPVSFWKSCIMCVKVPGCAAKLARVRNIAKLLNLVI